MIDNVKNNQQKIFSINSDTPDKDDNSDQINKIISSLVAQDDVNKGSNSVINVDSLTAVRLSSLLKDELNIKIPPGFLISNVESDSSNKQKKNESGEKKNEDSALVEKIIKLSKDNFQSSSIDLYQLTFFTIL